MNDQFLSFLPPSLLNELARKQFLLKRMERDQKELQEMGIEVQISDCTVNDDVFLKGNLDQYAAS